MKIPYILTAAFVGFLYMSYMLWNTASEIQGVSNSELVGAGIFVLTKYDLLIKLNSFLAGVVFTLAFAVPLWYFWSKKELPKLVAERQAEQMTEQNPEHTTIFSPPE